MVILIIIVVYTVVCMLSSLSDSEMAIKFITGVVILMCLAGVLVLDCVAPRTDFVVILSKNTRVIKLSPLDDGSGSYAVVHNKNLDFKDTNSFTYTSSNFEVKTDSNVKEPVANEITTEGYRKKLWSARILSFNPGESEMRYKEVKYIMIVPNESDVVNKD